MVVFHKWFFRSLFFNLYSYSRCIVRNLFVGCLPYLRFNKITVERGGEDEDEGEGEAKHLHLELYFYAFF